MPDVTGLTAARTQELISARMRWAGVWKADTQYQVGDLVRVAATGALWVARAVPVLGGVPQFAVDPEKFRRTFASGVEGVLNAGGNAALNDSGHLTISAAGSGLFYWNAPLATDQDYVQTRFHYGGGGNPPYMGAVIGGSSWNLGVAGVLFYARNSLLIGWAQGAPANNIGVEVPIPAPLPTDGWIRLQRAGNDVTVSLFEQDPIGKPDPTHTASMTLPTALRADYGAGVDLVAGVAFSGTGPGTWVDDVVLATPYVGDESAWDLVMPGVA